MNPREFFTGNGELVADRASVRRWRVGSFTVGFHRSSTSGWQTLTDRGELYSYSLMIGKIEVMGVETPIWVAVAGPYRISIAKTPK